MDQPNEYQKNKILFKFILKSFMRIDFKKLRKVVFSKNNREFDKLYDSIFLTNLMKKWNHKNYESSALLNKIINVVLDIDKKELPTFYNVIRIFKKEKQKDKEDEIANSNNTNNNICLNLFELGQSDLLLKKKRKNEHIITGNIESEADKSIISISDKMIKNDENDFSVEFLDRSTNKFINYVNQTYGYNCVKNFKVTEENMFDINSHFLPFLPENWSSENKQVIESANQKYIQQLKSKNKINTNANMYSKPNNIVNNSNAKSSNPVISNNNVNISVIVKNPQDVINNQNANLNQVKEQLVPVQVQAQIPNQVNTQMSTQVLTQLPNQVPTQIPTQLPSTKLSNKLDVKSRLKESAAKCLEKFK